MGYYNINYQSIAGNRTNTMFEINKTIDPTTVLYALNSTCGVIANSTDVMSKQQIECVMQDFRKNLSHFDQLTLVLLVTAFAILILFGVSGNGLVCYVVARNPHMRTPRNIYIINLAISDLTLCLFTQPLNLLKACATRWVLGDFMCKFVPMFAGTNVFVSTISITAIALDRFQVIVYPTRDNMRKVGTAVALTSIWLISFLMASPLLIFNSMKPFEIEGFVLYEVCLENAELVHERGAYSVACMIFQYLVPILIVSVAHARICNKLRYRMVNQHSSPQMAFQRNRCAREARRKRRTNTLLVMIGIVFACAWLPLNVFNIMADFNHGLFKVLDPYGLLVPICHLLVLCSACTNPVLYGWLNENFRKEFMKVFCSPRIKKCLASCACHCVRCRTETREEMTATNASPANGTLLTHHDGDVVSVKNNNDTGNNEITAV